MTRYVTQEGDLGWVVDIPESTPLPAEMEEQYRLYRLCPCGKCSGTGKTLEIEGDFVTAMTSKTKRCGSCRGEGRTLELVATCGTKEAVGVALVTLTEEGEWDECPFGLMHRPAGQTGRWLLKPWPASPRNVTDAARLMQKQRKNPVTPS